MSGALTDRGIKAARPRAERYEVHDGKTPGLYLVVQPSGHRGWAFRYRRPNGKPAKLTIGPLSAYPLGEARKKAADALRSVTEGRDPAVDKKEARRKAADTSDSVEVLLDKFIALHVRQNNRSRTAAEVERLIKLHIKPVWSGRKIGDVSKRDVIDLLERVEHPIAANRALSVVRKFCNWLINRDVIQVSPAAGVQPPYPERSRDRVLTADEIQLLWRATEGTAPLAIAVRLLLLSGQRRNEVAEMRWSELRLDGPEPVWIIGPHRAKNGVEHSVPIVPQVADIIRSLPRLAGSDFVLTTTGTSGVSGFSGFKLALDLRMVKEAQKRAEQCGGDSSKVELPDWRFHDLRRTVASGLADLGERVEVAEKVLNHTSGTFAGIVSVYQKHTFANEKRRALAAWARHVESLVTDQPNNVVPLARIA